MAETAKFQPKFRSFEISPTPIAIPVDGTLTSVKVNGTVESIVDGQIVDVTVTHPNGKSGLYPAHYGKTETDNLFKFEYNFGVDKNTEKGTYYVEAVLREDANKVKSGKFEVV